MRGLSRRSRSRSRDVDWSRSRQRGRSRDAEPSSASSRGRHFDGARERGRSRRTSLSPPRSSRHSSDRRPARAPSPPLSRRLPVAAASPAWSQCSDASGGSGSEDSGANVRRRAGSDRGRRARASSPPSRSEPVCVSAPGGSSTPRSQCNDASGDAAACSIGPESEPSRRYRKVCCRIGGCGDDACDLKGIQRALLNCTMIVNPQLEQGAYRQRMRLSGMHLFVLDPSVYTSLVSPDLAGVYCICTSSAGVYGERWERFFTTVCSGTVLTFHWFRGVIGAHNYTNTQYSRYFVQSPQDRQALLTAIKAGTVSRDCVAVLYHAYVHRDSSMTNEIATRLQSFQGIRDLDFEAISQGSPLTVDGMYSFEDGDTKGRSSGGAQLKVCFSFVSRPPAFSRVFCARGDAVVCLRLQDARPSAASRQIVLRHKSFVPCPPPRPPPRVSTARVDPALVLPPLPASSDRAADGGPHARSICLPAIVKTGPMDSQQLMQVGGAPLPEIVCSLDQASSSSAGERAPLAEAGLSLDSNDVGAMYMDRLFQSPRAAADGRDGSEAHDQDLGLFPEHDGVMRLTFTTDDEAISAFLRGEMGAYGQAADAVAQRLAPPPKSGARFYGSVIGSFPSLQYLSAAMDAYDRVCQLIGKTAGIELPPNPLHCTRAFTDNLPLEACRMGTDIFTAIHAIGGACADCLTLRLPFIDPLTWTFVGAVMLVAAPF